MIVCFLTQGMYIKSTYDGLHVITGTTEHVSMTIYTLQEQIQPLFLQKLINDSYS